MFKTVTTIDEFNNITTKNEAVLFYLSTKSCNVCKILKPKIAELFGKEFPKIGLYYVDTEDSPDIAGQKSVFAVPTIIIYLDGKEFIRESRNISIDVLKDQTARPYSLMFD